MFHLVWPANRSEGKFPQGELRSRGRDWGASRRRDWEHVPPGEVDDREEREANGTTFANVGGTKGERDENAILDKITGMGSADI